MLLILDGWGIGQIPAADAILAADTPTMDALWDRWPHSTLTTFGEAVGLPAGQMGNSEVGHLNIGAGRVVYQELVRVGRAIADGSIADNEALKRAIAYAQKENRPIHLMGLLSDGGVHSHIDHLLGLCELLHTRVSVPIYIHCFMDGRDTDPRSGKAYLQSLLTHIKDTNAQIATVIGRYYAMDRDKRWERVKRAYDLLTGAEPTEHNSILSISSEKIIETVESFYKQGITDEFMEPVRVIQPGDENGGIIRAGDVVICTNFRTDRCREITEVLTQTEHPPAGMHTIPLHFVTMTRYDESFKNIDVIFEKDNLIHTLGEAISAAGKTQLRIAETEKYPHVTFFFNGGREAPFEGETRIMVPSPKVATYDLQPEMSAIEVKDKLLGFLQKQDPDFVCLNFANTDMVGHTGVFSAAVKAAETVDKCLSEILPIAIERGYIIILLADHGNADLMINPDGTPNTAHTTNPVPCILVNGPSNIGLRQGKLADLAPSILELMHITIPAEMDGKSLLFTL